MSRLLTRAADAYYRRASRLFFRRSLTIRPSVHLISFSFDDFPASALTAGGSILRNYGLSGTYYASLGLMDQTAPSGQMFSLADLKAAHSSGHEVGCHTYSHLDSARTATRLYEEDIVKNQKALNELLPGARFHTFSYPISVPRPLTKRVAGRYFACCRGGGQTFNSGYTDLNNLSAYFLEKSRHDIDQVKSAIDGNRRAAGWLILATHDVSENPTPFGCTPAFFEAVVRYAVASGACILPVSRALEALTSGTTNWEPATQEGKTQ